APASAPPAPRPRPPDEQQPTHSPTAATHPAAAPPRPANAPPRQARPHADATPPAPPAATAAHRAISHTKPTNPIGCLTSRSSNWLKGPLLWRRTVSALAVIVRGRRGWS